MIRKIIELFKKFLKKHIIAKVPSELEEDEFSNKWRQMKILLITIVFIPLIIYVLRLGWKINMRVVEKEIKWKVKQWEKKKK